MSYYKAKFVLTQTPLGELTALPIPVAGFKGAYF